jgi:hypothetical protein
MVDRTDDFNRANGGLGANWTTTFNALAIVSNEVHGSTAGDQSSGCWSADAFLADQYSQVKAVNLSDGGGPCVRSNLVVAGTFYTLYVQDGATARIYEVTAGSFAALGADFDPGASAGNVVKLSATGTSLEAFTEGTSKATRTDGSITIGRPGIHAFDTVALFDNWQGGPIFVPDPFVSPNARTLSIKRNLMPRRV